jgi:hypothetical protein
MEGNGMDHERQGGSRRRSRLLAGVGAAILALATATAASADTGNDDDQGLVPVAPPASSECQGPGCTDNSGQVQSLLQLLGTGTGCADGGVCFWEQNDFQGTRKRLEDYPCCDWYLITDIDHFLSAKNRYLARKVQTGNASYQTSCMDPGENRPDLDFSDRFRIGAVGSHCG